MGPPSLIETSFCRLYLYVLLPSTFRHAVLLTLSPMKGVTGVISP